MKEPAAVGEWEQDMVTSKVQPSTTRTRRTTPLPWRPSASSCFSRPTPPPLEPLPRASRVAESVAVAMSPPVAAASPAKPKLAYVPPPPVGARRAKPSPATLPPPPVGTPPSKPRLVPAPATGEIVVLADAPVIEPAAVSVIVCDPSSVPMIASLVDALASSEPTPDFPRVTTLAPGRTRRPWRRLATSLGMAASLLLAVGIASSTGSAPPAEQAPAPEQVQIAADLRASFATLVSAWASLGTPAEVAQPEPSPAETHGELPNEGLLALAVANPTEATVPRLEPAPQPRRSRRARHRTHASLAAAEVDTTPARTPAAERSSLRRRRPLSAAALLHDGEVALALGDAEQAYRLAKRSRDAGERADASSLVARSACRIGERDEAKQALRDLPLLERGAVRRDCRRSGGRIGL